MPGYSVLAAPLGCMVGIRWWYLLPPTHLRDRYWGVGSWAAEALARTGIGDNPD